MAIYHLTVKTLSRGSGSASASADYINREAKYSKDKDEALYMQSGNMPDWANDTKEYWKSADLFERENGRLCKKLEFSLPKELNLEEQKELVKSYVDKVTTTNDGKLPYSFAIHKGHDKENPHCHLMVSERPLDGFNRSPEIWFKRYNKNTPELGGSKKTTALMPKDWLVKTREEWSKQANLALERSGHEARIDHRTLSEQGIDREPTQHLDSMLKKNMQYPDKIAPTFNKEKEEELQFLKEVKQGINDARVELQAGKERIEREQAKKQMRKALILERERERVRAIKLKQEELERAEALKVQQQQAQQKQKSRGMSR